MRPRRFSLTGKHCTIIDLIDCLARIDNALKPPWSWRHILIRTPRSSHIQQSTAIDVSAGRGQANCLTHTCRLAPVSSPALFPKPDLYRLSQRLAGRRYHLFKSCFERRRQRDIDTFSVGSTGPCQTDRMLCLTKACRHTSRSSNYSGQFPLEPRLRYLCSFPSPTYQRPYSRLDPT
jgi:hypothetical protein